MSYPATEPTTMNELLQARYDALQAALSMHRRAVGCHPNNPHRIEWLHAQHYWTSKAYHYHGEILARRDPECFY